MELDLTTMFLVNPVYEPGEWKRRLRPVRWAANSVLIPFTNRASGNLLMFKATPTEGVLIPFTNRASGNGEWVFYHPEEPS